MIVILGFIFHLEFIKRTWYLEFITLMGCKPKRLLLNKDRFTKTRNCCVQNEVVRLDNLRIT